jgi:ElaB/YqjD/DUF883 family membrane-anchored ribosome-binding protein
MTSATNTDIQQLKDLIRDSNATTQQQIADLRLEMRTGLSDVRGDIRELRSELKSLDTKFDEKTKNLDQRISSREFVGRGVSVGLTVTVVGGLLLAFGKFLFFGKI